MGETERRDDESPAIPRHVGIVMDGNGRWAAGQGLGRSEGHRAGAMRVRPIAEACIDHGIKYLTIYALSTENWSRPREEIEMLLELIGKSLQAERKAIFEHRIRIKVLGSLDPILPPLRISIRQMERATANFDRLTLNMAFNYGGRAEIVRAVKGLMQDGIDAEDVTEDLLERYLYTAGQPAPDLIIRTGGQQRLSNFLMWQSAYAEFYWSAALWPDFDEAEFGKAIRDFSGRKRRYGGVETGTGIPGALGDG
ncbi:MAG TPA: polyprenyl diphosphate synthase [Chloroflexota bacterium]|nr:polyprenyl diphosphate synthase [Chloroflexota bacterium]